MSKSQMYLSKINATGADYISSPDGGADGTNKGYDLTGNVQMGYIRK